MPEVEPPDDLPHREGRWNVEDSILSRLDQRWASHDPERGRTVLWSRMPDLLEVSAPALAVLGDYVPMGIGQALALETMSNSLDNTLRVGPDRADRMGARRHPHRPRQPRLRPRPRATCGPRTAR